MGVDQVKQVLEAPGNVFVPARPLHRAVFLELVEVVADDLAVLLEHLLDQGGGAVAVEDPAVASHRAVAARFADVAEGHPSRDGCPGLRRRCGEATEFGNSRRAGPWEALDLQLVPIFSRASCWLRKKAARWGLRKYGRIPAALATRTARR